MHVLDEHPALERVLQHVHQRPVARQEDGGALAARVAEVVLVDELESHQGLARPRNSGDQRQVQLLLLARLVGGRDQRGDRVGDAGTLGLLDLRQRFVLEDAPGGGHQRGQRGVVGVQPALGVDGLVGRPPLQLDDHLTQRPRGLTTATSPTVSPGLADSPGEHQYRIDQLVVRGGVVVAEVARVGGHLVDVGALEQARSP